MREDRKKGLLLIDHRTLMQCTSYLRDFLRLSTDDLTIGIINYSNKSIAIRDLPVFIHKVNAIILIIPYAGTLAESITPDLLAEPLNVILLSTTLSLVREAEQLSWTGIKVPFEKGELAKPHLDSFRETLDQRLATVNLSNPFSLIISLDIDETTIFFSDSMSIGRLLFNTHALRYLKDIFETYCTVPGLKIEIIVLTARSETEDKKAHKEGCIASIQCVINKLSEEIQDFLRTSSHGPIPAYYTEKKHEKLIELYGTRTDALVMHLDDNTSWTDAFDSGTHQHLKYASVKCNRFPLFIFPCDEMLLSQFCEQYAAPERAPLPLPLMSRFFRFEKVAAPNNNEGIESSLLAKPIVESTGGRFRCCPGGGCAVS